MTFRVAGDPDELERRAGQDPGGMKAIVEKARGHGLIAHRFYGADGQIMVVDEWPDPESLQRFVASVRYEIEPMMREVATGDPDVTFWRKLETHDEVGWDA
jgi:hypothetical protein